MKSFPCVFRFLCPSFHTAQRKEVAAENSKPWKKPRQLYYYCVSADVCEWCHSVSFLWSFRPHALTDRLLSSCSVWCDTVTLPEFASFPNPTLGKDFFFLRGVWRYISKTAVAFGVSVLSHMLADEIQSYTSQISPWARTWNQIRDKGKHRTSSCVHANEWNEIFHKDNGVT